jgi:hypothetical protein
MGPCLSVCSSARYRPPRTAPLCFSLFPLPFSRHPSAPFPARKTKSHNVARRCRMWPNTDKGAGRTPVNLTKPKLFSRPRGGKGKAEAIWPSSERLEIRPGHLCTTVVQLCWCWCRLCRSLGKKGMRESDMIPRRQRALLAALCAMCALCALCAFSCSPTSSRTFQTDANHAGPTRKDPTTHTAPTATLWRGLDPFACSCYITETMSALLSAQNFFTRRAYRLSSPA